MLELPSPAVVSLALVFLFLVALAPVFFALGKVVLFQLFFIILEYSYQIMWSNIFKNHFLGQSSLKEQQQLVLEQFEIDFCLDLFLDF